MVLKVSETGKFQRKNISKLINQDYSRYGHRKFFYRKKIYTHFLKNEEEASATLLLSWLPSSLLIFIIVPAVESAIDLALPIQKFFCGLDVCGDARFTFLEL